MFLLRVNGVFAMFNISYCLIRLIRGFVWHVTS
jgi:hypothetical protein